MMQKKKARIAGGRLGKILEHADFGQKTGRLTAGIGGDDRANGRRRLGVREIRACAGLLLTNYQIGTQPLSVSY
jgi:hypothetical protein